ncbi:MAG: enoyl-CoA hydratase/isomerase family protein, partial [Candidatus Binataceae bacterium]
MSTANRNRAARRGKSGAPLTKATNARTRGTATDRGTVEPAREGGALVATLKRPAARNRISAAMARDLMELAEAVEDDDAIVALVITGAGSAFSVGFDADVDPKLVETLAAVSKPTIAIINGDALDEGLELALAVDLRAAVINARFALTQLTRGALPCFGGTQRLPRLIGAAHALRMILTGVALRGSEATRLGLVTYAARDRAELARVARELLGTLGDKGPLALRLVKDAVHKGYDMTLDQGIRLEEDLYALLQT